MFDIGFWEIALIAVVALLVVGPDEFPALVRNMGGWLGKIRRFMSDTRQELEREFHKAEELKKLMEQEAAIAELHKKIDPGQPAVKPKQMSDSETQVATGAGKADVNTTQPAAADKNSS